METFHCEKNLYLFVTEKESASLLVYGYILLILSVPLVDTVLHSGGKQQMVKSEIIPHRLLKKRGGT